MVQYLQEGNRIKVGKCSTLMKGLSCVPHEVQCTRRHTPSCHRHALKCGHEDSRVLCLVHANISLSSARAFQFSLSFLTVEMWQHILLHSTCLCLLCTTHTHTHHTYTFPEITRQPPLPHKYFCSPFFFPESFKLFVELVMGRLLVILLSCQPFLNSPSNIQTMTSTAALLR